jgi:uncharacterized membrane protein
MFEVSFYALVLFIHVASAIVLIGSSLFAPLARRLMQSASSRAELLTALDLGRRAGRFNPPSAMVLLASGLYLGSLGWWTQGWFIVAVLAWIANAMLASLVIHRAAGALAGEASKGGEALTGRVEALRYSRAWTIAARVMFANDVAMLYLMMMKPALLETLLLLGAANAVLVIPVLLRQDAPRPAGVSARVFYS